MFIDKTKIELGNYNNYSYRASQKTKKKKYMNLCKDQRENHININGL